MKRVAFSAVGLFLVASTTFSWWHPRASQSEAKPHLTFTHQQSRSSLQLGELTGFELTPIKAAVTGIVVETYFYEGQFVQKGQLLAKLWVRPQNEVAYVTAPQPGVVTDAHVAIREPWPADVPLLWLTNPTRPHVRLTPGASASATRVQLHDRLSLQLANDSAATALGQVVQLDPSANPILTLQLAAPLAHAAVGSALLITPAAAPTTQLASTRETQLSN